MEPHILGAILFIWPLLVVLQVFIHYFMIEEMNERPIYLQWGILRGMFAIIHGALFLYVFFWEWLVLLTFQLASHFVIYNPLLNKLRDIKWKKFGIRFPFSYLGKDSGWLDRLFIKDIVLYKIVYVGACISLVGTLIVMYNIYL